MAILPMRTLLWLFWSVTDRLGSASLVFFFFFFCVKYCAFTVQCLQKQRIHTMDKISNNITVDIGVVTLSIH